MCTSSIYCVSKTHNCHLRLQVTTLPHLFGVICTQLTCDITQSTQGHWTGVAATHGSVQLQGTQLLQSQQHGGRQAAAPVLKTKAGLRPTHRQTLPTCDQKAMVVQNWRGQKKSNHHQRLKSTILDIGTFSSKLCNKECSGDSLGTLKPCNCPKWCPVYHCPYNS